MAVKPFHMTIGIEKHLMLVLAAVIGQRFAKCGQFTDCDLRIVTEAARPALRVHLTSKHDAIEITLDHNGVRAGTDHLGAGLPTQQETNGFNEDSLACAGLAGEGGQAGVKRDLECVENGEVSDVKCAEHGYGCS